MDYGHWFRRGFHLCAPLFLLYYLVPGRILGIVSKELILLLALLIVLIFEAVRLRTGWVFFGLRGYESKQLSAFAWAGIGLTIAFLFFPQIFVICVVIGMGWTDPLIGELRRRWKKGYPAIPLVQYFFIVLVCLSLFSEMDIFLRMFLAGLGSVVAITVERPRIRYIDDDFLMMVIPLVVLTFVHHCLVVVSLA